MKSRNSMTPRARTAGVVVEHLADEVLVYDLERDRAHCLNLAAARVWERCDGNHCVTEIASEVGGEEVAWMAVEQLGKAGLLEERIKRPGVGIGAQGGDKADSGGGGDRRAGSDEHSRSDGQSCG